MLALCVFTTAGAAVNDVSAFRIHFIFQALLAKEKICSHLLSLSLCLILLSTVQFSLQCIGFTKLIFIINQSMITPSNPFIIH
jgi:hypothetical protein